MPQRPRQWPGRVGVMAEPTFGQIASYAIARDGTLAKRCWREDAGGSRIGYRSLNPTFPLQYTGAAAPCRAFEPTARRLHPALASLAASLPRFCAGWVLRCPRASASAVASARSCRRWCSSSKSREFAACSHFLSAAARVGGRSVRPEPLRVGLGTARSFEVECALNAEGSTIRLFANSGKGIDAPPLRVTKPHHP